MLPFTIILGLLAILINAATIPSGTVGDIAPTASSINSTFGNTGLSTSGRPKSPRPLILTRNCPQKY